VTNQLTNVPLKNSFAYFNANKSESALNALIFDLKKAKLLVLVDRNGLEFSDSIDGKTSIKKDRK